MPKSFPEASFVAAFIAVGGLTGVSASAASRTIAMAAPATANVQVDARLNGLSLSKVAGVSSLFEAGSEPVVATAPVAVVAPTNFNTGVVGGTRSVPGVEGDRVIFDADGNDPYGNIGGYHIAVGQTAPFDNHGAVAVVPMPLSSLGGLSLLAWVAFSRRSRK